MEYLFITVIHSSVTPLSFLLCTATALILGLVISLVASYKSNSSNGYKIATALLPIIIEIIIMLVNGNLGAGVAVAGTFSLIRFRSTPASAKEITTILLETAVGLACGMGYIGIAAIATIVISLLYFIYTKVLFKKDNSSLERTLKITISEDLDYTTCFNEVFNKYLSKSSLIEAKTINFGSMFKLTYKVKLIDAALEKELIDEIRTINANLDVILAQTSIEIKDEL